jgi:hypothetical protein
MKTRVMAVFGVVVIVLLQAVLFLPQVLAEDVFRESCSGLGGSTSFCQDVRSTSGENKITGPNGIVTKIGQVIVFLAGGISLIMIVVGGFKYAISAGDSNAVTSAKNTVLYAIIGLVITIFSQVIVSFVLSKF